MKQFRNSKFEIRIGATAISIGTLTLAIFMGPLAAGPPLPKVSRLGILSSSTCPDPDSPFLQGVEDGDVTVRRSGST